MHGETGDHLDPHSAIACSGKEYTSILLVQPPRPACHDLLSL
jgi:hypothetical protein